MTKKYMKHYTIVTLTLCLSLGAGLEARGIIGKVLAGTIFYGIGSSVAYNRLTSTSPANLKRTTNSYAWGNEQVAWLQSYSRCKQSLTSEDRKKLENILEAPEMTDLCWVDRVCIVAQVQLLKFRDRFNDFPKIENSAKIENIAEKKEDAEKPPTSPENLPS